MKMSLWCAEWRRKAKIKRLRRMIKRINDPMIENDLALAMRDLINDCYYNCILDCAKMECKRGSCPSECLFSPNRGGK
jgi:hypothetical protein